MKRFFKFLNIILNIIIIILIISFSNIIKISAQEENSSKPLELPNFIIEGREQLNVSSGIKQMPSKSDVLSKSELDSMNTLEKQQPFLIPPQPLPERIQLPTAYSGYLDAQVGLYLSPRIEAGYLFPVSDFGIYCEGLFENSGDFVKNSGFTKASVNVSSDYTASDKYFIFGGSRTNANINFNLNDYKMYVVKSALKRTYSDLSFSVDSKGEFETFGFDIGAVYKTGALVQDNIQSSNQSNKNLRTSDNRLLGYCKIKRNMFGIQTGARLSLDFRTTNGLPINYLDLAATGEYSISNLLFNAELGLSTAHASNGSTRATILFNIQGKYFYSSDFTFSTRIFNTLYNNDFSEFLKINPYIDIKSPIDFGTVQGIDLTAEYHPLEVLSVTSRAGLFLNNLNPYFEIKDTLGSFGINYAKTSEFRISSEAVWNLSSKDKFLGGILFRSLTFKDGGNYIPHSPAFEMRLEYSRIIEKGLEAQFGLVFVGKKYADSLNQRTIDSYPDLRVKLEYMLNDRLAAYLRADNLLNSNIYYFEGYKERNIFVSVGVLWKF